MNPDKEKEEAAVHSGKRPPDDDSETKQHPPQQLERSRSPENCKNRAVMDAVETVEIATRLEEMFHDAQMGLCRFIAFGLYAYEVKELRLNHGQFGEWIKQHCQRIPWRTANHYMALTKGLLYACGCKIEDYIQIRKRCEFDHGGELILKDPSELPDSAQPLAIKMRAMVEGKTARQLFLEFKTAEDVNGELMVRRPGIGDAAWEKWMWEYHPNLIKEGKVPGRQHVKAAIKKEFDAFCLERQRRNHDPIAEAKAKQKFADDLWDGLAQSLWRCRDKLHLLSDHVRDQVLDACVETSNAIRAMKKGGKRS